MKKSLNEHINRMKYLTVYGQKSKINEQTEQIDSNFERELKTALDQVMRDLPNQLNNLAKTTGDRDGQLEIAGDQQQNTTNPQQAQNEAELNEAIGAMIAGGALALPAVTGLVGKASQFLGKKLDNQKMQDFGKKAIEYGHKLHHAYENVIDKMLQPLTKNLDPKKREFINKAVFYSIIATFLATGAVGATSAAASGNVGVAAGEGFLSSIKAGELVAAAKEIIPRVLASSNLVS